MSIRLTSKHAGIVIVEWPDRMPLSWKARNVIQVSISAEDGDACARSGELTTDSDVWRGAVQSLCEFEG